MKLKELKHLNPIFKAECENRLQSTAC